MYLCIPFFEDKQYTLMIRSNKNAERNLNIFEPVTRNIIDVVF